MTLKQFIDGRCDICAASDAKGYWHKGHGEPIQACEECANMEPQIVS